MTPVEAQNLKSLLLEAANKIEAYVAMEHGNPPHPALARRHKRDMEIVYRLRAAAGCDNRGAALSDLAKQDGELL
jgi:hypothetical protein